MKNIRENLTEAADLARDTSLPLSPLVLVGLLAGPFMSMMDSSVVNVAIPTIARELEINLAAAQWVVTSYLLAFAFGLPATAFLAKRLGTRPVYTASIAGFTLASMACALAPSFPVLVGLRALQGLCGSPLVPLAMTMLLDPSGGDRPAIPPIAGALLFLAPALGPTLGGLLLRSGGWQVIFLINVPIGLLGFLGATGVGRGASDRGDPSARFDPLGLALASLGLTMLIYGSIVGAEGHWLAGDVWPFWSGGAILLFAYVLWAVIRSHPALDLKLLRHRGSALSVLLVAAIALVSASNLLLAPIYLQRIQGASPLVTGLVLLPQGLVTGVGLVLGNALPGRLGRKACVFLGLLSLLATTLLLLLLGLATPAWVTALLFCGRGLATGLAIQPLLAVMLRGLTRSELPDGTTLFNVTDNLSGALGVAVAATLFQERAREQLRLLLSGGSVLPGLLPRLVREASMSGFHDTILALALPAALALVAVLFLPRDPPESEAVAPHPARP